MNIRDVVEFVGEINRYESLEISTNCLGVVVSELSASGTHLVSFLDLNDRKVVCTTNIKEKDLLLSNIHEYNYKSSNGKKIKIYDSVKLICDKERYKKQGLTRGDDGVVIGDSPMHGYQLVDFSDIDKGIHELTVSIKSEDIELI